MSWVRVLPPVKAAKAPKAQAAVTIRVSKAGRYARRAFLVVRPNLLPDGLDWWVHGAGVVYHIGDLDQAGKLRIEPGADWTLTKPSGKHTGSGCPNPPMLVVGSLDGMAEADSSVHVLSFVSNARWLEVTLPAWAKQAALDAPRPDAAAKPAALPQAKAAPYRMDLPAPERQPGARQPVTAAYQTILDWAIVNGCGTVAHGFDLAKVNQKRIARGDRPYSILNGRVPTATPRTSAP